MPYNCMCEQSVCSAATQRLYVLAAKSSSSSSFISYFALLPCPYSYVKYVPSLIRMQQAVTIQVVNLFCV